MARIPAVAWWCKADVGTISSGRPLLLVRENKGNIHSFLIRQTADVLYLVVCRGGDQKLRTVRAQLIHRLDVVVCLAMMR